MSHPLQSSLDGVQRLVGAGVHTARGALKYNRLVPIILGAALLGPSMFALWAAISGYQAGVLAAEAAGLPDLLEEARYSAVQQELLRLSFTVAPSPALRLRTLRQAQEVAVDLELARALAEPAPARAIKALEVIEEQYRAEVAGALAPSIPPAGGIGPVPGALLLDRLKAGIWMATLAALDREAVFDDRERQIQRDVLIATPLVLGIDVTLVSAVLLLIWAKGRRDRQGAAREAAALARSERRSSALMQNSLDVVFVSSAEGIITYWGTTAAQLWGYADDRLLGLPVADLIHPDDRTVFEELWHLITLSEGAAGNMEGRALLQDGSWRQVELILTNLMQEPAVAGIVMTARDIEARKAFETQMTQRAFFDALTGLPNRLLLHDRLEQALVRATRHRRAIALLFIDLDNFKLINDSLGHTVGDDLLIKAAARLLACGRAEDTVARLGGDEFVVLIDKLVSEADAADVAEHIARQFLCPFPLDGRDVVVTASIGLALGYPDRDTAESMLRNADVAMYRAKASGKGQLVVFDPSMHRDSLARLDLGEDLRHALERDEFRLHYQPIVDMASGRIVEAEALVRWQHPVRGLVSPGEFIPVAEEMGLIIPLGRWVLENACRQAAEWAKTLPIDPPIAISVNISPREFQQLNLDLEVAEVLRRTGLPPSCLKLEITEGVIMDDVEWTIAMMGKLKKIGVKLAVDDFGTGYSSLAYLKRLPLDVLKIDQSFVKGIGSVREDSAIVQAILSLAQSLNLDVTGEGIETAEQAEMLSQWNCTRGQGYFFLKPVDAERATTFLRASCRPGADLRMSVASDAAALPLAHSLT
ncbi:putative bifunctional diguanylate cyclase/phosphodiesterase [Acidisoma sp.]|uniref:putative bifunctional diguanylate cyclase/phosphodiesterase n=1 Tax=Acidisoma sp. TaxID=1872115 RepID=UPI003B00D0AB